jgi:hypothetical protein
VGWDPPGGAGGKNVVPEWRCYKINELTGYSYLMEVHISTCQEKQECGMHDPVRKV